MVFGSMSDQFATVTSLDKAKWEAQLLYYKLAPLAWGIRKADRVRWEMWRDLIALAIQDVSAQFSGRSYSNLTSATVQLMDGLGDLQQAVTGLDPTGETAAAAITTALATVKQNLYVILYCHRLTHAKILQILEAIKEVPHDEKNRKTATLEVVTLDRMVESFEALTQWNEMYLEDLRKECAICGVSAAGTKNDVMARLLRHRGLGGVGLQLEASQIFSPAPAEEEEKSADEEEKSADEEEMPIDRDAGKSAQEL